MDYYHPTLKISSRFSRGKPPNFSTGAPLKSLETNYLQQALAAVSISPDKYTLIDMHCRGCTIELVYADHPPSLFDYNRRLRHTNEAGVTKNNSSTSAGNDPAGVSYPQDKYSLIDMHYRCFTTESDFAHFFLLLADHYLRAKQEAIKQADGTHHEKSTNYERSTDQHILDRENQSPQLRRQTPEVARTIIPYLGAYASILLFKLAVCRFIMIMYYTYRCNDPYLFSPLHGGSKSEADSKSDLIQTAPQRVSNLLSRTCGRACIVMIILTHIQNSLPASNSLLPQPNKTSETVEGRKKPPLGRYTDVAYTYVLPW